MTNALNYINNSVYVITSNSPRSRFLPKHYKLGTLKLIYEISIKASFSPVYLIKIYNKIKVCNNNAFIIEHYGNILLNSYIVFFLLYFKKEICIDCHNSAVEYHSKHKKRYITNLLYLATLNKLFKIRILVHNNQLRNNYYSSTVLETPYPIFNFKDKVNKEYDVLFLCSLNSDEPIDLIIQVCNKLNSCGFNVKITGDKTKVDNKLDTFFFHKYLSYDEYINAIRKSHKVVCLTTRSNTLLFSPREAIALNVKCFVTRNTPNIAFYKDKVNYVSNNFKALSEILL
jgi:hypothetical protein